MANYTIIGGDGKQYGPITGDELRKWISEGRLNAQSMAKADSDAEFRALATFPELADAFAPPTAAPGAPPVFSPATLAEGDYNLDIGDCISRGWALVKGNFWPTVGVTALVMVTMGVVNQVFGLFTRPAINDMVEQHQFSAGDIAVVVLVTIVSAPVYSIFTAGLFKYYLKLIRGESAGVGDAFAGFGASTGQLVMLSVVQMILMLIGYALCFIPGIYLAVAWYFAIPLVIDKQMGFWEAMELSRKMASKHWFLIFGFLIVYGLLAVAGVIACCVGIFVTMPIGFAALMYAYETIFSKPQTR
jgi:uncharacterized membrane protein